MYKIVFQYFLQLLSPLCDSMKEWYERGTKHLWQTILVGEFQFPKNPGALCTVEHSQGTQSEKTFPKHVLHLELGQLLCVPVSLVVTVTILTTLR